MSPKNQGPSYVFGRRTAREFLNKAGEGSLQSAHITDHCPTEIRRMISRLIPESRIHVVSRKDLDRMVPGVNHQGVVLQVIKTESAGSGDWRQFLRSKPGFIVLLDRIQDPHNLGSITRTAEALGASGLYITGQGAKPGPTSDRVSAGASFHIPQFVVSNADQVIEEAKAAGYWIIVSSAEEDLNRKQDTAAKHSKKTGEGIPVHSNELTKIPPAEELILVIGSEGEGAKPMILKKADFLITVPLRGQTSSLNAGVAAGILIDRIINR